MGVSLQAGSRAFFAVEDVVCPTTVEVLRSAGPELAIQGRIMYLSDSGERRNHFAVVNVSGIHTPLIVPVDRLRADSLDVDDPGQTERIAVSG